MKIRILTVLCIAFPIFCFSQNKGEKKNTIGISIPLIRNNSNGVYYSLGNRQEPKGKGLSYGARIDYSRKLYKNWFGSIGVGYFNQRFNIIRPFYFDGDTITNLLYSTKKYNYHCITLNTGLGYSFILNNKVKLNGLASFNLLSSFRQSYDPNGQGPLRPKPDQINKQSLTIGYMFNLSPGIEFLLSKKVGLGVDVVLPIVTKWKDDKIFLQSYFGNDAQRIAENNFSIGGMLSFKYHF